MLAGQAGMDGTQGTLEIRSCWKSTSRELTRLSYRSASGVELNCRAGRVQNSPAKRKRGVV